ncbi:hypothetical protein [Gymnodinialimonas ulvae]
MEHLPTILMEFGASIATIVSENPILLVVGIGFATAIWRFSGRPSKQE